MIGAVIFDLDGTVLDNEQQWEEAFRQVVNKPYSQKWIHEPGIGLVPNWKKITNNPEKAEKLALETVEKYRGLSQSLILRPGIEDLVMAVKEKGLLTALATSSVWTVVEQELEELGLILAFDITTTGEEVLAMKPDPEIYILTAQKLEVDPRDCLIIEDSVSGVLAGVDAGMAVVALESKYATKRVLEEAGAKWVVENIPKIIDIINLPGI